MSGRITGVGAVRRFFIASGRGSCGRWRVTGAGSPTREGVLSLPGILKKIIGWDAISPSRREVIRYKINSFIATLTCVIPRDIANIFLYYETDKQAAGIHHYGAAYGEFLKPYRYRRIKILEIGVGGYADTLGGNSLLAWQAYFPFARIVGCDIRDKRALNTRNTRIYRVDQSSAEDLAELVRAEGPFDIVIDDGSHLNRHQIFTFEALFESVSKDGLYVLEDVQTSYWPDRVGPVAWDGAHIGDDRFADTCVGYFLDLAKYLNHAEFRSRCGVDDRKLRLARSIRRIAFEHNLIFVQKGDNTEPSNFNDIEIS
jgi:hypothetical protein